MCIIFCRHVNLLNILYCSGTCTFRVFCIQCSVVLLTMTITIPILQMGEVNKECFWFVSKPFIPRWLYEHTASEMPVIMPFVGREGGLYLSGPLGLGEDVCLEPVPPLGPFWWCPSCPIVSSSCRAICGSHLWKENSLSAFPYPEMPFIMKLPSDEPDCWLIYPSIIYCAWQ